jgi:uncharacterized damage-inducible protein DinB
MIDSLLRAFDINNRICLFLIDELDEKAWRAETPGGKGRDIASIVAHMHNVRLMWLKAALPKGNALPDQLDRAAVTKPIAKEAFKASHAALRALIAESLAGSGRIKGFKPDAISFVGYLLAHDAHHRGQITQLARQAGIPISQKAMFGMWEWNRYAEE